MHARLSTRLGLSAVAYGCLLAATACGQAGGNGLISGAAGASPTPPPQSTTTSEPATTTSPPPPPVWPLTGKPVDGAAGAKQGAVVVKIDNSAPARPHAGINEADEVYELQVEGITRFMVVFHSASPERVGPIRSARSSDLDIIANLHRPLLIWSGGNPGVTKAVAQAHADGILVDVGHPSDAAGDYYRDDAGGRVVPHNLFSNVVKMRADWTLSGEEPPAAMFGFRGPADVLPASAGDAAGMTVDFGLGVRVDYAWDAERACWDRFQVDDSHNRAQSAFVDEAGLQACPDNVVILFLEYGRDPVDVRSPKANSVGTGDGVVLSAGKVVSVHWSRPSSADGWNLTDAATGSPLALTPGRTWVALPQKDADSVIPMDPETAAGLLAVRR